SSQARRRNASTAYSPPLVWGRVTSVMVAHVCARCARTLYDQCYVRAPWTKPNAAIFKAQVPARRELTAQRPLAEEIHVLLLRPIRLVAMLEHSPEQGRRIVQQQNPGMM